MFKNTDMFRSPAPIMAISLSSAAYDYLAERQMLQAKLTTDIEILQTKNQPPALDEHVCEQNRVFNVVYHGFFLTHAETRDISFYQLLDSWVQYGGPVFHVQRGLDEYIGKYRPDKLAGFHSKWQPPNSTPAVPSPKTVGKLALTMTLDGELDSERLGVTFEDQICAVALLQTQSLRLANLLGIQEFDLEKYRHCPHVPSYDDGLPSIVATEAAARKRKRGEVRKEAGESDDDVMPIPAPRRRRRG
jgi:hypothetical protein